MNFDQLAGYLHEDPAPIDGPGAGPEDFNMAAPVNECKQVIELGMAPIEQKHSTDIQEPVSPP